MLSEVRKYTPRQVDSFLKIANKRGSEELKEVVYGQRLAYHGDDKVFKKFIEAKTDDG